jgi:serine/threonine protein kinase
MAPEIIKGLEYNTSVDIWALGIITHILFCGKPPFGGKTKEAIF